MNARLVLLLTRDSELHNLLSHALGDGDAIVLRATSFGEALRLVCERGRQLGLVVIDFAEGCHGMTLLSALNTCRPEIPIIVTTSTDACQVSVLAYAEAVAACLAKPISLAELAMVIRELNTPKLQLEVA